MLELSGKTIYDDKTNILDIPAISYGVLNRLAKLASRKPSIQAKAVDMVYTAHANALCKAGLAPPVFPTMGDL